MFDSPLSASAYEVLDVDPSVDDEGLRRAYRLQLRRAHPDAGGDAASFIRVQRAWEVVGTPEGRAAYDRGQGIAASVEWSGASRSEGEAGSRPRARSYGQAGGWHRRRYLASVREWAGAEVPDPYDPAFVRTVPRELRRMLADALSEEETARAVSDLGMGFTVWHDVLTIPRAGSGGADPEAVGKLDHVVLSPTGLYGVRSVDLGGVARFRGGEIIGPHTEAEAPVTALLTRMRIVARAARVRFGGGIVVVPDDALAQTTVPLGLVRGTTVVVARRSALRTVLRQGAPGARAVGGNELFDVRTRLQQTIRFA
ncbi:hypothetical protein J2Y69_001883 [Microbacterium resistens]|uniref:J domain-containing protein n=1 Tax=Microbacterium resistens TaxID=156977 RepID=A0ABU1SCD8_9MICO|nr:J domain-containing protein [Microbacterium resistens]MDR6867282.1 hypothetical protein [Microbacterium resistens]